MRGFFGLLEKIWPEEVERGERQRDVEPCYMKAAHLKVILMGNHSIPIGTVNGDVFI